MAGNESNVKNEPNVFGGMSMTDPVPKGQHSITEEMLDHMLVANPIEGRIWQKMIRDGRAVLVSAAPLNTASQLPRKCPA